MLFRSKKYKVEQKSIAGLIYSEGKKKMTVDSELLFGADLGIVIYTDSISAWDPPFDKEDLTEEDKDRILQNIVTNYEGKSYNVDLF